MKLLLARKPKTISLHEGVPGTQLTSTIARDINVPSTVVIGGGYARYSYRTVLNG